MAQLSFPCHKTCINVWETAPGEHFWHLTTYCLHFTTDSTMSQPSEFLSSKKKAREKPCCLVNHRKTGVMLPEEVKFSHTSNYHAVIKEQTTVTVAQSIKISRCRIWKQLWQSKKAGLHSDSEGMWPYSSVQGHGHMSVQLWGLESLCDVHLYGLKLYFQ